MERLTTSGIKNYLIKNYGEVRHECDKLKKAFQTISKRYGCTPIEMFHFIIEDEPIKGLYTHSYGFNTSIGRGIKKEFINEYYSLRPRLIQVNHNGLSIKTYRR